MRNYAYVHRIFRHIPPSLRRQEAWGDARIQDLQLAVGGDLTEGTLPKSFRQTAALPSTPHLLCS